VQFGHNFAQPRRVGGLDGAGNLVDEFVTDLSLFIPHRGVIEHGPVTGSGGGFGNVDILGHAAPRRFDRLRELVSYRCTHYPIGNALRNAKDVERRMASKFIRAIGATLAAAMAWSAAEAAECPRKDALGTSRVLTVDAATSPRVGLKSFPQTLPLADHEVVLTFDDGPWPGTTPKVLAALAHECVLATFFLIGRSASAHPEMVRKIAALGHTIGHHSYGHPNIKYLKPDAATAEIDKGIAAVEAALHGTASTTPTTPFFRFPYFESTPATLDLLQKRDIVVFGADLWASDWNPMAPKAQLKLLIERLQSARKGIILLHDPKAQTAAMLPAFLRYLRDNNYRVVHLVPRARAATATGPERPK
jgi:peptidoglycan/xylan/chitin deacetylase (PgdA/CDA1 family)